MCRISYGSFRDLDEEIKKFHWSIFLFEIGSVPILWSQHVNMVLHIFFTLPLPQVPGHLKMDYVFSLPLLFLDAQWIQLLFYFNWKKAAIWMFLFVLLHWFYLWDWIFMKSCLLILKDCNCPVGKEYILKMEIKNNSSVNKKNFILCLLEIWN